MARRWRRCSPGCARNDLIWNYWVNNYLLGNRPPAYDVLAWNADTTRLPGQFHCDLLEMVEKNPYINACTLKCSACRSTWSGRVART